MIQIGKGESRIHLGSFYVNQLYHTINLNKGLESIMIQAVIMDVQVVTVQKTTDSDILVD